MMNNEQKDHSLPSASLVQNGLLAAVFSPLEYAYDNWGETMNYMSEEEIEAIHEYDNKSDLDDYLRMFYEST